ncbi:transmembrane protein conserved [Trypanosoma vivax]|uniref:Transmembrane protein, conserved n=1 Tax=Trypanosoma vivax (strain Y486) TaxID=1055687 RepID=G0TR66_TRYVY|nr:hypothetical protein TRVL_05919 [Trypanosoma vivax]KAH8611278.1 transmembrane protein conserved [Trypanosoma vivax]CCC46430.1 conserved hypothetical protein [Trypanosoma vivax Y486]
MEEALFALLNSNAVGEDVLNKRRTLARAFEESLFREVCRNGKTLIREVKDQEACLARAVDTFLLSNTPDSLETFFLHTVTMLHCQTVLSIASGEGDGKLPEAVKEAAIALASAFFSSRLRAAFMEPNEDKNEARDVARGQTLENPLWFCFLCIFLQQLSACGNHFAAWQQFFCDCAAFSREQVQLRHVREKGEVVGEADTVGKELDSESESERLGTRAWGMVTNTLFDATVGRTRFRRTAILCRSFCPHTVAQAPGTTYQLLHTLHKFMEVWRECQREKCDVGPLNGGRRGVETEWKGREEALVAKYSERLGQLLGEGQVHAMLLATVIGAVLTSTYILSKRAARSSEALRWHPPRNEEAAAVGEAEQGELQWRATQFPPIGRLLEHLYIRPFLDVHLFSFCSQLRIGLSPTHNIDGRQKLALCLYLTEVCPVRTALAIYHNAISAQFKATQNSPVLCGASQFCVPGEAIAAYTTAINSYVDDARNELNLTVLDLEGAKKRLRHCARANTNNRGNEEEEEEEPMLVNGELNGPRFVRMTFPTPYPVRSKYLVDSAPAGGAGPASASSGAGGINGSAGGASKQALSTQHITPYQFVLEFVDLGLPLLAAETIKTMREDMGVNVCLVPSSSIPTSSGGNKSNCCNSLAGSVMQHVLAILNVPKFDVSKVFGKVNDPQPQSCGGQNTLFRRGILHALEEYLPLLESVYAYVASQSLLCPLLERLADECRTLGLLQRQRKQKEPTMGSAADVEGCSEVRSALALAERYLVGVIMPCMRVISPSPILYDRVQLLLLVLNEMGPSVHFGTNSVEFLHTEVWLNCLLHHGQNPSKDMISSPYRAPHDRLRSKELEALFAHSLKRLTQGNVSRYRAILRPAIYANPLFIAEKMFQQAVGYSNNFLLIHTQLLHGAPPAVMTMIAHAGLLHMRQFAESERFGTTDSSRVGRVATFLAVLWRDNPYTFDGGLLLRAAELALRREARASTVFGLELLRAILHELLDMGLEHEEKYNTQQLRALLAPSRTQWFAKGSAESFRRGRWCTVFTPAVLAASTKMLQEALKERCVVPVETDDSCEDSFGKKMDGTTTNEGEACPTGEHQEKGTTPTVGLTLGQAILLHLCRLHSCIYDMQADLAAPMQLLLLTCARDFNVINDLLLCVESLVQQGPSSEEIFSLAPPHVALRLTARFAAKDALRAKQEQKSASGCNMDGVHHDGSNYGEGTSSASAQGKNVCAGNIDAVYTVAPTELTAYVSRVAILDGVGEAIPFSLQQKMSHYTAAHFFFDESVYTLANRELNQFFTRDAVLCRTKNSGSNSTQKGATFRWLQEQTRLLRLEREAHQKLYEESQCARNVLLNDLRTSGALCAPVEFAKTYLLPRALISFEDTLFVFHFMRWLLEVTQSDEHERVVDVLLSLVTVIMTFFVGFTDGECMRVGFLLSLLLAVVQDTAVETPPGAKTTDHCDVNIDESVGTGTDVPRAKSLALCELERQLRPHVRPLVDMLNPQKSKTEEQGDEEKDSSGAYSTYENALAFPLQLEAYICRALVQLLVHQWETDFLHRNAILVLERLVKNKPPFPSTLCATEWLITGVSPHAVRSSSCYASATAVLKLLRETRRRRQEVLQKQAYEKMSDKLLAWRKFLETRETFMQSLLAADMEAADKQLTLHVAKGDQTGGAEVAEDKDGSNSDSSAAHLAEVDEQEVEMETGALVAYCTNHDESGHGSYEVREESENVAEEEVNSCHSLGGESQGIKEGNNAEHADECADDDKEELAQGSEHEANPRPPPKVESEPIQRQQQRPSRAKKKRGRSAKSVEGEAPPEAVQRVETPSED